MPASSKFSIQVQTAFEEVMGGIEDERDNDVYTGDKFLAPRTTYLPHSWKQERHPATSIPESCSLDQPGRAYASLSVLRVEGETHGSCAWSPWRGSHWHRPSADGPDHKKATSSLPAPPSKRRFLLNRFSRNLKRLSRHLNRKYPVLNRITENYFKSRSCRKIRTACTQVKSRYRCLTSARMGQI